MGFFAVSRQHSPSPFSVEACHLSFWVLSKHWFKLLRPGFCYLFDVGLRIHTKNELRRVRVALPFDSDDAEIIDLSPSVLDAEFSPLIFGKPVQIVDNSLEYDGSTLGQGKISDKVVAVSAVGSTPDKEHDPRFSVWTIEFDNPIPAGEFGYIRFRLQVKKPGALWTSKGWGYQKRGMIADLRVADARESNLLGLGRTEAPFIVPIQRLFLFLGAPSYFVPNHVSPPLHYSRLLEPKVWGRYLNTRYSHNTPISIHQWRSGSATTPDTAVVDLERPYRAYMDVSREFGNSLWLYYIVGTFLLPVALRISNWFWSRALEGWISNHLHLF